MRKQEADGRIERVVRPRRLRMKAATIRMASWGNPVRESVVGRASTRIFHASTMAAARSPEKADAKEAAEKKTAAEVKFVSW